jgi:lipoprotein-releasing system ATP-binding protein
LNSSVVLECRDLYKSYAEGPQLLEVLSGVNLSVKAGERLAIVGASGAGKSTLLNMLGGLDHATSGDVWVAGQQLSILNQKKLGQLRNQHLGFVYQFHHLLGEFTALENVAMPLLIRGDKPSAIKPLATEMLERVGLGTRLQHKPAELSGGERQRVAIARALVAKPACVLLDEPTGNLDIHSGAAIHNLMTELNQQLNTSFIIVTHDLQLAQKMDRNVELVDGKLIDGEMLTGKVESH